MEVTQSTIKCGRLAFNKYSLLDRVIEGARVDLINKQQKADGN